MDCCCHAAPLWIHSSPPNMHKQTQKLNGASIDWFYCFNSWGIFHCKSNFLESNTLHSELYQRRWHLCNFIHYIAYLTCSMAVFWHYKLHCAILNEKVPAPDLTGSCIEKLRKPSEISAHTEPPVLAKSPFINIMDEGREMSLSFHGLQQPLHTDGPPKADMLKLTRLKILAEQKNWKVALVCTSRCFEFCYAFAKWPLRKDATDLDFIRYPLIL